MSHTRPSAPPVDPTALAIYPLTPDRWDDFETLFGAKGAYGGCWCMWWRVRNKDFHQGEPNKLAFHALVNQGTPSGVPTGLLGYDGATPVGWISLGPRSDFGRFPSMTSQTFKPVDETPVWSIVCFYVMAKRRRQGIARAMLAGAVDWARAQGVGVLEAYPVDSGEQKPPVSAFMGTASTFRDAGFVEVARRHPQRPIMRLTLAPTSPG